MEINEQIKALAIKRGYTEADMIAAVHHHARKTRKTNPPGGFDDAGRFYAEERTDAIGNVRSPSRAYPYSEMVAARSAKHCAQVFGGIELHVKRIAKVIEAAPVEAGTAHEAARHVQVIEKILKPVKN